jgi:hypothetical protein
VITLARIKVITQEIPMEYLTIKGAFQLKSAINEKALKIVLGKINTIRFDNEGSVAINRLGNVLSMEVEGEISGDVSIDVIFWLQMLKAMAEKHSMIIIDRIRWEINITLASNDYDVRAFACYVSSFLNGAESTKLLLV